MGFLEDEAAEAVEKVEGKGRFPWDDVSARWADHVRSAGVADEEGAVDLVVCEERKMPLPKRVRPVGASPLVVLHHPWAQEEDHEEGFGEAEEEVGKGGERKKERNQLARTAGAPAEDWMKRNGAPCAISSL